MSDISSANLLEPEKPQTNVLSEFVHSALHAGIVSPMRGAAQIADHASGSSTDKAIANAAESLGLSAPQPAEFGSSSWVAQQLGGAAGMIAPFMLTRGAVKASAAKVFGEGAVYRSAADLVATRGIVAAATHEAAISAASGLAFGTLLTPSKESNVGNAAFIEDRLKAGGTDAAIFGTLGFVSPVINHSASTMARAIEKHALTQQTAMAVVVLDSPVITSALAGLPAGAVSAELAALKDGRVLPTSAELKEHAAGMAFVGGAFGTAGWLSAQRPGTNQSNARYFSDSIGLTKTASANQVDFRLVDGKDAIAKLNSDIASGATDASAKVLARPRIDTLTSAVLGVDHRSLGDARTVILDHRSSGTLSPDAIGKGDVSIATCSPLEGPLAKLDLFPNRENVAGGTVWLRTDQAKPGEFSLAQANSAADYSPRARSIGRVTEVPLGNNVGIESTKFIDMGNLEVPIPENRNMFWPDPHSQGALVQRFQIGDDLF